jgi:hypothetical protein
VERIWVSIDEGGAASSANPSTGLDLLTTIFMVMIADKKRRVSIPRRIESPLMF